MVQGREKLPIAAMRKQILSLIDENPVVIVRGNTGCGKTTQVKKKKLPNNPTSDII